MHNIPVAFNPVTGRHTGVNIKKKYDEVCEQFGISDRVFKIVADQAKNVKTAFKDTQSKVDTQDVAMFLLIKQRQMDRDAALEMSAQN